MSYKESGLLGEMTDSSKQEECTRQSWTTLLFKKARKLSNTIIVIIFKLDSSHLKGFQLAEDEKIQG